MERSATFTQWLAIEERRPKISKRSSDANDTVAKIILRELSEGQAKVEEGESADSNL